MQIYDPTLKRKAISNKTKKKKKKLFFNLLKKKKIPALSLSRLTKILGLWLINVKHYRYFVCCHYLAKISVWKWVKPLISNFPQRGCRELFTSSFFFTCLQNIIYDTVTATSCWWCHTWLFTFCHPDFNFRKLYTAVKCREMSKSMCYDLSRPKHAENTDTM